MAGRWIILVVAVAAVALTSIASAGPDAGRQRVAFTMRSLAHGTFTFAPITAGRLKRDSGTVSGAVNYTPRVVIREGQRVELYDPVVWLLTGNRGTLRIREFDYEWLDTGDAQIGTGTWKVVSGTGAYAHVTGGGRSAHVGQNHGTGPWNARHEGFLTSP